MSVAARRALQSYGAVHNRGRVEGADPAQLIALLFDAGLDALRSAEAQLARGAWREKCASLEKASEIILALKDSLDLERGGELAATLDALYAYCLRRVLEANARSDEAAAREVRGYLEELRGAWGQLQRRPEPAPAAFTQGLRG